MSFAREHSSPVLPSLTSESPSSSSSSFFSSFFFLLLGQQLSKDASLALAFTQSLLFSRLALLFSRSNNPEQLLEGRTQGPTASLVCLLSPATIPSVICTCNTRLMLLKSLCYGGNLPRKLCLSCDLLFLRLLIFSRHIWYYF